MRPQLTPEPRYEPLVKWRCARCGAAGETSYDPADDVLLRWDRVVRDHGERSAACASIHGGGDLVVVQDHYLPD